MISCTPTHHRPPIQLHIDQNSTPEEVVGATKGKEEDFFADCENDQLDNSRNNEYNSGAFLGADAAAGGEARAAVAKVMFWVFKCVLMC